MSSVRARQRAGRPYQLRAPVTGLIVVLLLGVIGLPARAQTLVLDLNQGVFDDTRVAEAIAAAADWYGLAERGGIGVDGIVLRSAGRDIRLDRSRPDIDGARRSMTAAGYQGREPIRFLILHDSIHAAFARLAAGALQPIGLEGQLLPITPQTLDAAIRTTRIATGRQMIEIPYLVLTQDRQIAPRPDQLADLIVAAVVVDFDRRRRQLRIQTTIANRGNETARPHQIAIIDHSQTIDIPTMEVAGIRPRESRTIEQTVAVPEEALGRALLLQAEVDADNKIPESDEGNNLSDRIRHLLPELIQLPDLVVRDTRVDFDNGGRELRMQVTIANLGAATAGPHQLAIVDHGRIVDIPPVPVTDIRPGASRTLQQAIIVPEEALGRTAFLVAEIDAFGAIREADERNNRGDRIRYDIPAPPILPDLVVKDFTVDAESRHGQITIRLTIANQGTEPARPHRAAIYDHSGLLGAQSVPVAGIGTGLDRTIEHIYTVPATALGQPVVLQAEIDPDAEVPESEEGNNLSDEVPVRLPDPPPADLVITAMMASKAGDSGSAIVAMTVGNQGESPSVPTLVLLSVGDAVDRIKVPVPALDPGGDWTHEQQIAIREAAFGGSVLLTAIIDPDDLVDEIDESNNRAQRSLDLDVPVETWIAIGGLAVGLVALVFLVGLRLGRRGARESDPKHRPAAPRVSYRAKSSASAERVEPAEGASTVTLRVSLRPAADAGRQTVSFEDAA